MKELPFSISNNGRPQDGQDTRRAFVVGVPGVAQSSLSDEDTASLLNWMARTLSDDWTAGSFREYSATEVQHLRATVLTEVAVRRIRLTKALRLDRR